MPKIEISLKDINSLLRRNLKAKDLEDWLQFAKCELESIEGDRLKVDVKDSNRPDLWSAEGIARELRGALRIETGLPKFSVAASKLAVNVDKKVAKVRPKIAAAVVRNVKLDDRAIAQLIQLQEKVALTYGRKRAAAAIGVYDYDKIVPPIKYTAVGPGGIKFVPLGAEKAMTPVQILKQHPKGVEYGHLLSGAKSYPVLIDSAKNVLSMPPIINSEHVGKVTGSTKNLFIEVTGWDMRIISTALNVMVAALAERGGKIENVRVDYGKSVATPDLTPRSAAVDPEKVRSLLGLTISDSEIIRLLQEARYDARKAGNKITVKYPAYRADIMHERDVIEDIAISFGYNDFAPSAPKLAVTGEEDRLEAFSDRIRELMVGFGMQEVMTFTLTNYDALYKKMHSQPDFERAVEIANPVSERFTVLRNWLTPSLIELLSRNTHVDYPQRIFEVGDVVWVDQKEETRTRNVRTLAVAVAAHEAGYTDMKAVVDAFAAALGAKLEVKEGTRAAFIAGRQAAIFLGRKQIGWFGEIKPEILNEWRIEVPVVTLEILLEPLMK